MARIRSIKPEFWTSEQVMECSLNARLLFIGIWNFADDLGRMPLSIKTIKASIFPGDDISIDAIRGMIVELSKNDLVLIYENSGREYLHVTGWNKHQRIDKPQSAKHPGPFDDHSTNIPGPFPPDRKGKERIGKEGSSDKANALSDAEPASRDFRSELFHRGLETLARLTGKGPDACRSFVGKCLKAASDDAVTVLGLIEDADRNHVVDPSAWIAARLKATGPPGQPLTEHQQRRRNTEDIRDELEHYATGSGSGDQANPRLLPGNSGERSKVVRGGTGSDVVKLPTGSHRSGG